MASTFNIMIAKIIEKARFAIRRLVEENLPPIFCKSRFLASVYYCFFSGAFSREQQAVLAGKVKHLREARKNKANYFLLVRNTHRIEKGLLMRPRKKQFATSYIRETLDSLGNIRSGLSPDQYPNLQQKWFDDVISEYFNAVCESPLISEQRKRFKAIVNGSAQSPGGAKSIPYCRELTNNASVNFDDFLKLTMQRRSVRWYLPKPVPREEIDKAILAARQSPSACNRQPFEFRIFDEPELVRQLIEFPMGTKGYGHSIPVFVVILGNLDAYASERDRHVIYIDGALTGMTFMLALETLGLSSCAINWPDIEEREEKMKNFLDLRPWQRPIMCMGLGYPDPEGKVAFSEKRSLDDIRKYNLASGYELPLTHVG